VGNALTKIKKKIEISTNKNVAELANGTVFNEQNHAFR